LPLLLALLAFSALSCARGREDSQSLPLPDDEATLSEREQINAALERIEALTAELGQARSFRELPIVVTSRHDYTHHPAACVSLNGKAQFILIRPEVLSAERMLWSDNLDTTLFRVLLHEIGHCYFQRDHDDTRIASDLHFIQMKVRRRNSEERRLYSMLDVSVMASDSLELPVPLEKYYVAELLGLKRATRLADFRAYGSFQFVPILEE
jgi:hypothetical protein